MVQAVQGLESYSCAFVLRAMGSHLRVSARGCGILVFFF